jgi:hypothetical protein
MQQLAKWQYILCLDGRGTFRPVRVVLVVEVWETAQEVLQQPTEHGGMEHQEL